MDEPVNGLPYVNNLEPTDIIWIGRTRLGTAGDKVITAQTLIASLSYPPSSRIICVHNQTTLISFGMPSGINSIALHCHFIRNGQSRSEIILLSYCNGNQNIGEGWVVTVPDSISTLGITVTCDSSYTLNLDIAVDNSSSGDVTMLYNILSRL